MLPLIVPVVRTIASSSLTTACAGWIGKLFARVIARQLQVPEALVRDAASMSMRGSTCSSGRCCTDYSARAERKLMNKS